MDPITLATAAVSALIPYLVKAGEKIAGNAGDAAWKQGSALFSKLKTRFADHPAAATALTDLAAEPEDPDAQGAVRKEIRKLLGSDPGFLRELMEAVGPAPAASSATFVNQIEGAVENLTQVGVAHELHIGRKS